MPVPAGGGEEGLVLFTPEELDAWTGKAIVEATGLLVLELVTAAIRNAVGAARYDALTDLSPLKQIALELARRMTRNVDGRRSVSRQLDDYTVTDTYASETLAAPVLTDDDLDQIWLALGLGRRRPLGAFTIRPAYTPDTCRSY
jgi:hypothetical protein